MAKKSTYHYRWGAEHSKTVRQPGGDVGFPLQVVAKSKNKADKLAKAKASARGWVVFEGLS